MRLFDTFVLDENLKCLAHAFGINQGFEEEAGAGLLSFGHGCGLQVGEFAVARQTQQKI